MNWKPYLASVAAVGIVANVLDFVVHGNLFSSMYYSKLPQLFRQDMNVGAIVFGDFVAAAVLVWFYQRVLASFGTGPMNGLKFGIYAGIFMSFPAFIFVHLTFAGYPYSLSWAMTVYGVVWCAVSGAIAGMIYGKSA
ncbi:MAG: hypothetical protein ACKV22_36435 [Bryobacteraceae bacterium]